MYRQWATESSSSSWAAFLPRYSLLSKIAFGKVQGEATWTSGKAVFVPIRWALNFRWDWTHLAAHRRSHTCSLTLALLLTFLYPFGDWSKYLHSRGVPQYPCIHIIPNYTFSMCFSPLLRKCWTSCRKSMALAVVWRTHCCTLQVSPKRCYLPGGEDKSGGS